MTKLVWDNDRMTVKAGRGLQSRGTCEGVALHPDRKLDDHMYPIMRVGAYELQRQAQEALKQHKQRQRQAVLALIDGLS